MNSLFPLAARVSNNDIVRPNISPLGFQVDLTGCQVNHNGLWKSWQQLDDQVRKSVQSQVICQKALATCLDRSGQMDRIGGSETILTTDHGCAIHDRRAQLHDLGSCLLEKSIVDAKRNPIGGRDGIATALQSGQIAHHDTIACGPQSGNARCGSCAERGRLLDEVDNNIGVEVDQHEHHSFK
jgi:hypothetical protein